MLVNCCRICLNNNAQSFDITSDLFKRIFTEIIGDKNVPDTIYLCKSCRSILIKMKTLVNVAVQNRKVFSAHQITQKDIDLNTGNLFMVAQHDEHTDKLPTTFQTDFKIKEELIEYVNAGSNHGEFETELTIKREDVLDVEETFELRTRTETEVNDINIRNKKEMDYDEMKFEVRYLNLEEQLAEIECKRSLEKYKRMQFKCSSCGVGFLTSEVYEDHRKRHAEAAGPHECATCHLRFKSQDVLSHHTLSHRRRFSCRLCPAVFNRWSHCVAHRFKCDVTNMAPEPTVCELCHKIFSNKYLLAVHVKGVHKARNYACYECEKKFISKQRLTAHVRSHTGDRPFACKLCPRTFAHHSNLVSHQATHDPSRPHYCVECDTRYKTRRGLFRHLAEATYHSTKEPTKYTCPKCPEQFVTEKRLKTHIDKHLNPMICQLCDKIFSSKTNLSRHVKRAHFL